MFKYLTYLRSTLSKLVIVSLFLTISNADANEWQVISELPIQRKGFSTTVVDGKIYLIGGTLFENERNGPFGMSLGSVYILKVLTFRIRFSIL